MFSRQWNTKKYSLKHEFKVFILHFHEMDYVIISFLFSISHLLFTYMKNNDEIKTKIISLTTFHYLLIYCNKQTRRKSHMISCFSFVCSSSLSNIHESLNNYARVCSAKKVHQVHPVFFSTRECPILLAHSSSLTWF